MLGGVWDVLARVETHLQSPMGSAGIISHILQETSTERKKCLA